MLIGGWLLLAYHQPTRLYGQLILGLAVVSLSSMAMLLAGQVQTALLLNRQGPRVFFNVRIPN